MQILIWGVTRLGRYLINNLRNSDNEVIKPIAFVDNNVKLHNTLVDEIPVISPDSLKNKYILDQIVVLLVSKSAKHIFQILGQCQKMGIANVGIVKPSILLGGMVVKLDNCNDNKRILWSVNRKIHNPIIPRIEVNLIDGCNLKCKGCTHFSSIYKEDSIYSISDYINDLRQIRKAGLFLRLRLLGGEPFLLNNLDDYIHITRDIFHETDIEVVTNGLLIPKTDDRIFSCIKQTGVIVTISPYSPTLKISASIIERLDAYGIMWQFEGEEVLEFSRGLTLQGTHNAKQSCEICSSAQCAFLRNGRLYKCPVDGLINDFYKHYGLDMVRERGTDIYREEEKLYDRFAAYITQPIELCKYCAEEPEIIPWCVEHNPSLEDWLYKDGSE